VTPAPAERNAETARHTRNAWLRALAGTAEVRRKALTLPQLVEHQAERFGSATALADEGETVSFAELAARMNGYARWARAEGLGLGETACLFLPNCADYLALWLGMARTGASVALVNTNLKGASLAYAISIVSPRLLVVGAELAPEIAAVLPEVGRGVGVWAHGASTGEWPRIETAQVSCAGVQLPDHPQPMSRALLLYTSGTTGLPKAANISHFRLMQWSAWFAGLLDASPADRLYDCLPLYHSTGGIVGPGAMLAAGGSTIIRRKFSARRCWDEVRETDSTLFVYVGELCRFLLNTSHSPQEMEHRIRCCFGNGFSANIWRAFQKRFAIPHILEFYAATEGAAALYNCEGEPGAIGRIPGFLRHRLDLALVRFDFESGVPKRGADGFCIACAADEAGEALAPVDPERIGAGEPFEGYLDFGATKRKILLDVFAKGDAWFRTGDLMRADARGFYYFVDRIGDTFRCNGENVSTEEVADAIAACPGVAQAVVYGVHEADTDGCVGMAAIVTGSGFDLESLRGYLARDLPAHARPRYLRLCPSIARTGTFKPLKQQLAAEGCDPSRTADPLYADDGNGFVPLCR
jgi:fatty-acyl-CoA synthase